jgi:N utilization substance protein B
MSQDTESKTEAKNEAKTETRVFPPMLNKRSLARRLTVQAVYQYLINETPVEQLLRQFREQPDGIGTADGEYFNELLRGVLHHAPDLTLLMIPALDRPLKQIDPVEHAILLLGTYELQQEQHIPFRVVVNEIVNLAKTFGAEDGHKFVNGVMDKLARQMRPTEVR